MQINPDRLLSDLHHLRGFGQAGTGVDRVAFSAADIEARRWLATRMRAAGLDPLLDRVGNVYGRDTRAQRAILIGSHTDTVPMGGWLDGALGVIYGLEIARASIEAGNPCNIGIDVISFEDEEGTYLPCLGSRSFCDDLREADIDAARSRSGAPLAKALAVLSGAETPVRCDRGRTVCYLEAHIEQGPRLESANLRVGIVTGLVGIRRFRIRASGRADHAGTTPMAMRHDAGMALIRFSSSVADEFERVGSSESVWNIGHMAFRPGAANVVPSEAEMILEFRDTDTAVLDRMEGTVLRLVEDSPIKLEAIPTARIEPAIMTNSLQETIASAAHEFGEQVLSIPSGAGHDAMMLSRLVPSAMLFIPSIGGRSHDPSEDTSETDIVLGCKVLARAVSILQKQMADAS